MFSTMWFLDGHELLCAPYSILLSPLLPTYTPVIPCNFAPSSLSSSVSFFRRFLRFSVPYPSADISMRATFLIVYLSPLRRAFLLLPVSHFIAASLVLPCRILHFLLSVCLCACMSRLGLELRWIYVGSFLFLYD